GTATTEAAEFVTTYGLQAVPIPTNRDMVRDDEGDLIYRTEDAKFAAVADDIEERHEQGQPILVGTISVEKSEKLSRILEKRGVRHEVLNAKQHAREANIVTQAGRLGSVTVATNMAGRGVDILLGGNPEGLAHEAVVAEGIGTDPADRDEAAAAARLEELTAKFKAECQAEGDEVRAVGGLYVLGTERHESRRIDNQLRGRAGRQGDPGASRFYLSLEDELMRLFATGAMAWVMTKAMPDDVPIEAKMVTKAIERAQNTVETRNAEIRKNVLKYDEVMNEQRKVVYKLRDQILDGEDLRDRAVKELAEAVSSVIATFCVAEFSEEWDLDGLAGEIKGYWPSELTKERLAECSSTDELYELLVSEATARYEAREVELTPAVMREVERQVMLRIIDQKWREHLQEMDYLREGINLRAMGQKDPLNEWQREGFGMFEQMMQGVARDFVRYAMQVQVNVAQPGASAAAPAVGTTFTAPAAVAPAPAASAPSPAGAVPAPADAGPADDAQAAAPAAATVTSVLGDDPEPQVSALSYSAPEEGGGSSTIAEAAKAQAVADGRPDADATAEAPAENVPVRRTEWEKTPRNAPCPCGSGKKFKMCHGA
ncbi:MAG: SEC-C metal-binding domain-containing protein, partial [Acidimicrobiales bacterium]